MKTKIAFGFFAFLFATLVSTSLHATPIDGLTVALSPDNGTLIAAGSNRAFLRMDPATLEVKERVWNGLSITRMAFSKDGAVLAATDGDGTVTLFDAKTLQRKTDVKNCEIAAFSTKADLFAGIEGNRRDNTTLHIYGLGDGASKMKVKITPKIPVTAVALDLEGKLAAVLYEGQNDASEAKSTPDAAVKGFDRTIAQQKADGRTSLVEFYEVPTGKKIASHTLFYSCSGTASAAVLDGKMIVVNYQNQNAAIGQDGSVKMFECANSFNYGIAFSTDYSTILTGGLANLSLTTTSDLVSKGFSVKERLPSWPEYFKGFAGNAEGVLFGASDGYRVFAIDRNASIKLEKPAF
jgi:WD40 repeat protein